MSNPPPKYPAHLEPQAPADAQIEARLTRIETRLVRLMAHLGLMADGTQTPVTPFPQFKPKNWNDK